MSTSAPGPESWRRSSWVALAALAAWSASLAFDVFVPYGSPDHTIGGFGLLVMGWLGVLGVSAAWFANPLFLIALARVRAGGSVFAMAAALLALHSLRVDAWPTGGGGNHYLYGYGVGFAIWLAAMGLALVATGMRVRESSTTTLESARLTRWLRELGLIWLIALVAIVVTLAVKDRAQAATSERERLRSVLFKRGPVCDKEPPVALSVLKSPEILMIPLGAGYPFHDPVTLLGWGIPTVRMNWYDYTRVGTGVDRMIRATSGRADVSATLSYAAETSDKGSRSGIRIGLVAADNQTLLNFVWVPDGPSSFCPEYVQLPSVGQQPRKVVLEALGLPDRPDPGGERNIWDTIPRFDGRVVDREVTGRMAWANNNIGCPAGTGFSYDRARSLRIAGTPFFLEEAAYLGVGPGQHSVCSGNVVYVYGMQESSGNFYLTISKRSLGDLRRIWAANIKVEKGDPALKERHTRIVSIAEAGELLHIRTRHYEHDQVLTIEAPLPRVESR